MRMTTEQMQTPRMTREAYLDWFTGEFMVENLRGWLEDLGSETCRRFTANGIRYARHFHITRDDLVAQFLFMMWAVGPDFWRFPGFSDVLSRHDLPEASRIDALFKVPEGQAARAIEETNMDYWYPKLIEGNVIGGEGR